MLGRDFLLLLLYVHFFSFKLRPSLSSLSHFSFSLQRNGDKRERLRRVLLFLCSDLSPLPFSFPFSCAVAAVAALNLKWQPRKMCTTLAEKNRPPPLAPFKGSLEIGFLWLPIKRDCRARPTKVEAEVGPRVERSNSCHSTSIQRPFSLVHFSICVLMLLADAALCGSRRV